MKSAERFTLRGGLLTIILLATVSQGMGQKCGTQDILLGKMSVREVRLDLPLEHLSASNRFMLHYSFSGDDAVSETYLDSAEVFLDRAWDYQVNELGYPAPVPGEGGYHHVYFMDLPNLYGYTVPSASSGTNISSYMVLDNDYRNAAHASKGLNGLRVTVAHEFFHTIHFTMRLDPFHLYFYEWSAVWMEEQCYPLINDYLYYLRGFYDDPELSIRTSNGIREYALCMFPMVMSELAGQEVIREGLTYFAQDGMEPLTAFLTAMQDHGYSEEEVARAFAIRVLLTGTRSLRGFGFKDAAWFPTFELSSGNCGDFNWCSELGEWGMMGGALPGGIQGLPNVSVEAQLKYAGLAGVYGGGEVSYTSDTSDEMLNGSNGVVAALSMESGRQSIRMWAQPERSGLPVNISLSSAYPNPSNDGFRWQVSLDRPGIVEMRIFSILGREVYRTKISTNTSREARLSWDGVDRFGKPTASGMYILRAAAGSAEAMSKVVLIR